MDMTPTIVTWARAMTAMARLATRADGTAVDTADFLTELPAAIPPGIPNQYIDAAASCAIIVKRNGPVSTGSPIELPTLSPKALRLGPRIAPAVVAHTTMDRSRARRSGVDTSVTAKRA